MGNFTSACLMPLAFPLGLNQSYCDAGFLCPYVTLNNSFTWPSVCPPTIPCQLTRLGSDYCAPQGVFEPWLCPPGSYCPDSRTQLPCVAGTYCPRGSSEPLACRALTYCPDGSPRRRVYGGVLISVLADLLLVAIYLWLRHVGEPYFVRRRRAARAKQLQLGGGRRSFVP